MQNAKPNSTSAGPPFKRCPRCAYSLRGLPADHACPECGLKYDQGCEWFPARSPRQFMYRSLVFLGIGCNGVLQIKYLFNYSEASTFQRISGFFGLACIVVLLFMYRLFFGMYRQGPGVAITCEGLIVRLPTVHSGTVPWAIVTGASIITSPQNTLQAAVVNINEGPKQLFKQIHIGAPGIVLPTRADVERFVDQINARANAH